jgi:PAS domain S-box-containing protein
MLVLRRRWYFCASGGTLLLLLIPTISAGGNPAARGLAGWLAAALAAVGALGWVSSRSLRKLEDRLIWLEGTLDAVPQPLTVTDLDMRWVFINRVTEGLLKRSRAEVMGRHCSEWKAHICNTDKCGIRSLRAGEPRTAYMQPMPDGAERRMQVDTSYILDRDKRRIGHVEIVTDIHASHELASLHQHIASAIEEMSAAVTELEAQTKANAESARTASGLSQSSEELVQGGNERVQQLVAAMKAITDSSQRIGKINKAIDEIAFQTNILALNAAVEAARAGSAGAGFAVVADEVRNLAARAATAAHETAELLGSATASAESGASLAQTVAASLVGFGDAAARMNALLRAIAGASAEQSAGISQIAAGLRHVEQTAVKEA